METKESSGGGGVWSVRRVGPVTFAISKPKRNRRKLRQARLKSKRRAR